VLCSVYCISCDRSHQEQTLLTSKCSKKNTRSRLRASYTQAYGANYSVSAKDVRDKLAAYFVGQGQVYWQWKRANVVVPTTNELNPEHFIF